MSFSVDTHIKKILGKIRLFETRYGHELHSVTLLAVSKKQSLQKIKEAIAAGQQDFGESYLQEALPKITALSDENIAWHFIGPIQSNKTRGIAENFDWVHSVCQPSIAERLSRQRPSSLAPLNMFIQVNISNDPNKAGIAPDSVSEFASIIETLPQLRLRGLMGIPAQDDASAFKRLHELQEALQAQGSALDCLSMGMSGDFEEAIANGATCVRIGSAIFGQRG
jgi:pyridoxal phosphate enzyme (YggS family)